MIEELLTHIRDGDAEARDAARTLGLLLERAARPSHIDQDDIVALLDPEYADRHLSVAEREAAITGLAELVSADTIQPTGVVKALGQSADPRAVPVLIDLLGRTRDDPAHASVAHQALTSLIPLGGPAAQAAVRDAAEHGQGEVAESARRYLRVTGA